MLYDRDRYIIPIDGRWSLEDLYKFPRSFEQVYYALEAIAPAEDRDVEERILRAFQAFPWRGGYSAVGFYNQLKWATSPTERPTITQLHYSSPGIIELALNLPLAIHVGAVVSSVAGSIHVMNRVYHRIHTDLQERKLLRIEVERKRLELTQEEMDAILKMGETMSQVLDLPGAHALHSRTQNPLISLKILLSVYRRIRTLAEFKIRGKANLRSASEMVNDGDL